MFRDVLLHVKIKKRKYIRTIKTITKNLTHDVHMFVSVLDRLPFAQNGETVVLKLCSKLHSVALISRPRFLYIYNTPFIQEMLYYAFFAQIESRSGVKFVGHLSFSFLFLCFGTVHIWSNTFHLQKRPTFSVVHHWLNVLLLSPTLLREDETENSVSTVS